MPGDDNVFLLVPETYEELIEKTGMTLEALRSMYEYDQSFGLVSKIYLLPAKPPYPPDVEKPQLIECKLDSRWHKENERYEDFCMIHDRWVDNDG